MRAADYFAAFFFIFAKDFAACLIISPLFSFDVDYFFHFASFAAFS